MTIAYRRKSDGLFARVKALFLSPTAEWDAIAPERTSPRELLGGYAALLAAIPALSELIGRQLFFAEPFGHGHRPSLLGAVPVAVVTYVLNLAVLAPLTYVVNALSAEFGGEKDREQAFKVAVYVSTIIWVAGGLALFPPLAIVGEACAFLAFYPLLVGLPKLMRAPETSAVIYAIAVFMVLVGLMFLARGGAQWTADVARMVIGRD